MKKILILSLFTFCGAISLIGPADAAPVRLIAGLDSITFWERTGGTSPTALTFGVNSSQLITQLTGPLTSGNNDISGAGTEFYDVFYSNADGTQNIDGEYLTIEGVYSFALPAGGGLNLAEISLNFSSTPTEFGNFVSSFTALGNNGIPGSVGNAIDGDLQTHTTMGNTIGQPERLRITLGFLSSSGPPSTNEPFDLTIEQSDVRVKDKPKDNRINFEGNIDLGMPFSPDDVEVTIVSDVGPGFNDIETVSIPAAEFACDLLTCSARVDDPSQIFDVGDPDSPALSVEVIIPVSGMGAFEVSARNTQTVALDPVEFTLTLKIGDKTGESSITMYVKDLGEKLKFPDPN